MAESDFTVDLWQIASNRANLTDAELEHCAPMTNEGVEAATMAISLNSIAEIVLDNAHDTADGKCTLDGAGMARLLFIISNCLENISAKEFIAADAAFMLKERYRKRAESGIKVLEGGVA